jgi:hypothetical protein
MRKYIHLLLVILGISLFSCENFLEPIADTRLSEEELLKDPAFLEGLLLSAYNALPNDYDFGIDVAAGDAVTNLQGSPYTLMSTGGWKSSFNPISQWETSFNQIYNINLFLEKYGSIVWANDPRISQSDNAKKSALHLKRLKGEAYGLRAWYEFQLLQYHAGKAADGRLLGFPIIKKALKTTDNWKLPRNTFSECVKQIMDDLDTATTYLPKVYADISGDGIYNATMGARYENRMNGNAAGALKSRVALLAASPSFSQASNVTWEEAATIAGSLCKELGGLYAGGIEFYSEISNKEIIWNRARRQIRSWETDNFPPSLFGKGRTNPSQSLIEAFPMKNGYPISQSTTPAFDPSKPYDNRDARLLKYIICNGSSFKSEIINTYIGADMNGINALVSSTRSGYYLKKFMNEGVNLDPLNVANAPHTYTLFRMTEVLLNFAEAANEAWGPDADPNGYGFTARTKIGDLRKRAGITADTYLASLDKDGLRDLIQNERRIELCFEGFRFWDIRRLNKISDLNVPVSGAYITQETGTPTSYRYENIEERKFDSYMIYGPVPYNEILKYDIIQNAGW